jgi:ferritin
MLVLISPEMTQALNQQIGHELGASLQYLSIAAYFDRQKLKLLANLFFKQSAEENEHALKFVRYVLDTKGDLRLPSIPAPTPTFSSAEEAVAAALKWEEEVTGQINALMTLANEKHDYLAQGFLQGFVDEQLEEVSKMDQLLTVIRRAGEKNLIMVEAYLVHIDKAS